MDHEHSHAPASSRRSLGKWILAGFLLIAAYFLWTEHRAHVTSALPYLLLLACPLLHLFHGRGHGHDGHSKPGPRSNDQEGRP